MLPTGDPIVQSDVLVRFRLAQIGTEKVATPAFFTGPAVRELPRDSVSLVLPFPNSAMSLPMIWQAEADIWFRMPGGYFIGPAPDGRPRFGPNPSPGSLVFVRSFVRGFPGQPVFAVTRGHGLPRGYASLDLRPVDRISYVMPVWEETRMRRPASATGVPLRFSFWRVGNGAGSG
jgi:hypothetical protein